MPPPSSGGIALLQILAMLETFELPPRMSVEHVHLLAEIEKRAFADRASHLGDPDYYDVPARELLDPDYIKTRLRGISPSSRTAPERVGAGEPLAPAGAASETTHFSVLDGRGMAVACTTTLNGAFGSGIVVDGAGFLLNNEMDDFSAKPGVPNQFGVTGGEANAIAPGKRMLSSMTPTLVFRPDGSLWMALGSPGGPTIITTVMQVLSNRIDYDLTLEEAIDAPRVHHQWPPRPGAGDAIVVERDARYRVEESLLAGLRELGYSVTEVDSLGDVQAVAIEGGAALGVFDERRTGGVAAE
jgi:gamma-glutamyltranspeptidase/glutathione hydrolase